MNITDQLSANLTFLSRYRK